MLTENWIDKRYILITDKNNKNRVVDREYTDEKIVEHRKEMMDTILDLTDKMTLHTVIEEGLNNVKAIPVDDNYSIGSKKNQKYLHKKTPIADYCSKIRNGTKNGGIISINIPQTQLEVIFKRIKNEQGLCIIHGQMFQKPGQSQIVRKRNNETAIVRQVPHTQAPNDLQQQQQQQPQNRDISLVSKVRFKLCPVALQILETFNKKQMVSTLKQYLKEQILSKMLQSIAQKATEYVDTRKKRLEKPAN